MPVSPYQRAAYDHARDVVGEARSVRAYYNSDESIRIPIAQVSGSPDRGLTTFFTAGLGEHRTSWTAESGRPLRFEFLAVAADRFERVAESLATCSNLVASGAVDVEPGLVHPDPFEAVPGTTTPHAFLWWPFDWDRQFEGATIDGVDVEWLLVIPITDHERDFVLRHGPGRRGSGAEALVDAFEAQAIDVYDLAQASTVLPA